MAFEEQLPQWENEGTQPPQSKRVEGWLPNEKPPASWFNWLFGRTYRVLKEFQEKAAEKVDVQQAQQTADDAATAAANAQVDIDDYKNEIRLLGLGIDVDPRLSSDLNNETQTGWVRFESDETANAPGEQIASFPHFGVVRVDRRNNNRLAQTAYGVAGDTSVRIAVRVLGSTGWGDWVEVLHTGNASPGVIGAVSRTGDTMSGDLTINKSVPLLELIHEATGTFVNGGLIMRNFEQNIWRVGALSESGHFYIDSFTGDIILRSASYRYSLRGPNADVFIIVHDAHPEGSIPATVGSLCLRIDSGSHAKLYVKNSGTGNTGWVEVLTS